MMITYMWIMAVILSAGAPDEAPVVDGLFDEWSDATLIATDPPGDADNVFDITEVHAVSQGTCVFLYFDTTATLNMQAGPAGEGTLRLELGLPNGTSLTVDFRGRIAYTADDPGNYVSWPSLNFVTMTTYAADRFELRLDMAQLGIQIGDTIAVDFSGSDELITPGQFTLTEAGQVPAVGSALREPCTGFRVANLNTLSGGLLDGERGPAIGRLIQAVAADIYCFQEQNSPVQDIADRLELLDPAGNGAAWNVHTSSDTVIAAQAPLIEIPHPGDAAAVVDRGADGAVAVFSIHPPCCGYIGSGQDQGRISEMQTVVDTIEDLRNGTLGPALLPFRYVPIVIIGDWNLVGSRTPLDLLEDSPAANQIHRLLPHLVGSDVFTWRDLNPAPGDFAPGLLDLVTYSAQLLSPRNGFVLDSSELDTDQLAALGLQAGDSTASDHLMIVADFQTRAGGDINGDTIVDIADLLQTLASWGPCPLCPADVDGDGSVDIMDLLIVLAAWGACE